MTLARDKASMADVLRLLRLRAAVLQLHTPKALARSMSCERLCYPIGSEKYAALCRFRALRQDARIAAARRALSRSDA